MSDTGFGTVGGAITALADAPVIRRDIGGSSKVAAAWELLKHLVAAGGPTPSEYERTLDSIHILHKTKLPRSRSGKSLSRCLRQTPCKGSDC